MQNQGKETLEMQSHVYRLLSYRDGQSRKARERLERDKERICRKT